MNDLVDVQPSIVAVSGDRPFLHLIQTLLDSMGLAVRTTSDWAAAPGLVKRTRPKLVILDLLPGCEEPCWLTLEAIRACATTRSTPVLVCPVAGWLLAGHEQRLKLHGVHVWPEGFDLQELLKTVELAVAA